MFLSSLTFSRSTQMMPIIPAFILFALLARIQAKAFGADRSKFVPMARDHPKPKALTVLIKEAVDVEALFCTFNAYESHMDHIHLSAC